MTGENGGTIPDTKVRISVKNLALSCLVSLFGLYPRSFLHYLSKSNSTTALGRQPITDVLLLANHADPQLRGVLRIVVASFIKAVMVESNGQYISWFSSFEGRPDLEVFSLTRLISFLIEVTRISKVHKKKNN